MAFVKKLQTNLTLQLLLALFLGVVFGLFLPSWNAFYSFLGSAFIRLINLIILPLVVPIVILSVANSFNNKSFSRTLSKSFIYFFAVTTVIIALSVLAAYVFGFGKGVVLPKTSLDSIKGLSQNVDIYEYFLSIIPNNIFEVLASGSLLSSIIFAILVGLGLGKIDEKGQAFINILEIWVDTIHQITNFIIKLLPFGIFGFIAKAIATTGLEHLASLAQFVIGGYIGYALLGFVFFPLIAKLFGISYTNLVQKIWDLIVLAFVSGGSSTVLPQLLDRLVEAGYSAKRVNIVLPLGYTFNLGGAAVYLSLATIFIANAYGIQFSLANIVTIIILLSLISKTAATIPSGAIVVLLATASQLGLPQEGVAAILAVDFFLNAGRTALNVVGNGLAVGVIEALEEPKVAPVSKTRLALNR